MDSASTYTDPTATADLRPGSPSRATDYVLVADVGDIDEGYAQSTNTSYVTSIASSIRRGIEENGRTYPSYGKNAYGMPVDESEQDRNDLQHAKFTLLLNNRLHLAPIGESPQKILDLGTGTGIWAIDMADKYPSAEVTGADIAAVQPSWVPTNCQFEIDDVEDAWVRTPNSYDFIHARELMLAIRDWPRLIEQCHNHLKPGGYLEISGTYPYLTSDDGTLPPDSAFVEFAKTFFRISEAIGASATAPLFYKEHMENAGFVDVQQSIFKIPEGPWAKDRKLKQIGALEKANFNEGMEALIIRGYTQVLGGDASTAQAMMASVRQELANPAMHAYIYL